MPNDQDQAEAAVQTDMNDQITTETAGEIGAVRIHHRVIAMIARSVTLDVEGVEKMGGSLIEGLANMISNADRGVRVVMDEQTQSLCLELHVVLRYGVRIPDVAWQIQTTVKQAVTDLTGKVVTAVDVIIQELRPISSEKPEETKPSAEEEGV